MKRVPDTEEDEIEINSDGSDIASLLLKIRYKGCAKNPTNFEKLRF